jgi:hypothetical protein
MLNTNIIWVFSFLFCENTIWHYLEISDDVNKYIMIVF